MKYFKTSEIILSEDTASVPKQIRFKECEEVVDLNLLKEGGGDTKSYPIGTAVIDMGQIAEGRWLYVKASEDIDLIIDGSATPLKLIKDKPVDMWHKFTSVSVTTTAVTRITIAIAGE